MTNQTKECRDCGGSMCEIKIIDRGATVERGGFDYTAVHAQRGFWSGAFPVAGKLDAYLCQTCGAVRLFGNNPG